MSMAGGEEGESTMPMVLTDDANIAEIAAHCLWMLPRAHVLLAMIVVEVAGDGEVGIGRVLQFCRITAGRGEVALTSIVMLMTVTSSMSTAMLRLVVM